MGRFVDITGWIMSEHGVPDSRLTVIQRVEDYVYPDGKQHASQWLCECNCDEHNRIIVRRANLTSKINPTLSCGCIQKEKARHTCILRNKKSNTYDLNGEYGIGYTVKNEPFWFDIEDYDKIKDYCWYYDQNGYVCTSNEKGKSIKLHRFVMDVIDTDVIVDHILHPVGNGKHKTDNRKDNLRIVSSFENNKNMGLRKDNKSGTKGVYWRRDTNKWSAKITVDNRVIHLGCFINKDDAIDARLNAEVKYFGEYAYRGDSNEV